MCSVQYLRRVRIRKTLSSWLSNRYLLIIRNEENFAEKTSFSFTYAKVILISFILLVLIFVGSLFTIETVLEQWFDPRHAQMEARRTLLDLSMKVDSLEKNVKAKEIYINRIKYILSGDTTLQFADNYEEVEGDTLPIRDGEDIKPMDDELRDVFDNMKVSFVNAEIGNELPFLFPPISGYVSQKFNLINDHLGVDIVSKENEPVKNIADGTVIFSDWTQDSGYVIIVQHSTELLSVYKHNAKLLKKVGSFVSEGEIISIIGNSGELTDGPHLHFELWHKGNPLNPEDFVLF